MAGKRYRLLLAALLLAEIAAFAITGTNFFTVRNAFEIVRLSVEVGLLSLALTPVIVTGGIDLSVGSLMGLCAVVFGMTARLPLPVAIAAALGTGLLGGWLNAFMIGRLQLPPLIITLGTYSLFRGLAEGMTHGLESYSGFPPTFLTFGQGYQLIVLAVAIAGFALLLHATGIGRALFAIGFAAPAARYAGIPVARRMMLVYVLSGFTASVAAIVYAAHLGQTKSDAGTGYELMAITAVVLGGTSIFGGRGGIGGTLLGLALIAVLQNGLRLSDAPAELAGIATGILLIGSIAADRLFAKPEKAAPQSEGWEVKNAQVAVLSAAILLAALTIAGSNWMLVRGLRRSPSVPVRRVIGVMPKAKGDPYFASCRTGAEEAARELGVDLIWDGPTDLDPAKQNEVVEGWITRGVNAIAVSVSNQAAISTVLRKARAAGISTLTWDADAEPDARDWFVNQATPRGIGTALMDETARLLGGKGEFAIVTGALSAANQNEWIRFMKERLAQKYPGVKMAVIRPSDDDRDRAFSETQSILKVYPEVKVIVAISAPAVPGAGEAVKQSGRQDVHVTGLSLPSLSKAYVHSGSVSSIVLWNTRDLGYLVVQASNAAARGTLKPGATQLAAGRLGTVQVQGDNVILGAPFIFNQANIDRFSF
ncbi:MAG: substrate-binding domain-containing protein [Acidobacteriota bacterium]|nr:substrate-binding domain-containing protein [Acidobacteriota bacterium]